MAVGSTYRRCSCRGAGNKVLGAVCPKLKSSKHGQWFWRVELPVDADGNRRPRRRGGFDSSDEAQKELDHVRALLALADEDDAESATQIGDVIALAISAKEQLPPVEDVRRKLRAGISVTDRPTVGEWLAAWFPTKKKLSRNGRRSCASGMSRTCSMPSRSTTRRSWRRGRARIRRGVNR